MQGRHGPDHGLLCHSARTHWAGAARGRSSSMNRLHRSAIKMGTACALATMLCVASLSVADTSAVAAATAPELTLNVLAGRHRFHRPDHRRVGLGPDQRRSGLHRGHRHRHLRGRDRHPARPHHRIGGQLRRRGDRRLPGRVRLGPAHLPLLLRVHLPGAPDRRLHRPLHRHRGERLVHHRRAGRHQRDPDGRRAGRTAGPGRDGALFHRHQRLPGHRRDRGPLHLVARPPPPARSWPVSTSTRRTDPQAGVSELALNFDYNATDPPVGAAGPRAHQLGDQRHPPRPRPQLRGDGHRRHLHPRQRLVDHRPRQRLLRRRLPAHGCR